MQPTPPPDPRYQPAPYIHPAPVKPPNQTLKIVAAVIGIVMAVSCVGCGGAFFVAMQQQEANLNRVTTQTP